ncbi:MAG TPA: hypothetical protein VKT28_17545 [Puia sp.]|nr:hypothetical protein [Puia sp.]
MQTVVNLHGGFQLNIFPIILAALVFFIVIYLITGRKAKKPLAKDFPSRNEAYDFMYSQLLEKEAAAAK